MCSILNYGPHVFCSLQVMRSQVVYHDHCRECCCVLHVCSSVCLSIQSVLLCLFLYVCPSVCLYVVLSFCVFVYTSILLCACLCFCPSVSVFMSVFPCVCLYVCVSVCLS